MLFMGGGINYAQVFKSLGNLLVLLGLCLLIPMVVASVYDEHREVWLFLSCAFVVLVLGYLLKFCYRNALGALRKRGALLLVPLAWFIITLIGAFPYIFSGYFLTFTDALFESASGFTTTGSTILSDIEILPKSLLFWRSLTQYIGGLGIVVLSLAVLPIIGVGGMELYQAESPGPTSDKISARVSETARVLWVFYLLFALIVMVVYYSMGMDIFDALNHAFTTVATGGFSTKNASITAFNSVSIEIAATIFMFFAGTSFLLHYKLFIRGRADIIRDREFRFYCLLVLVTIFLLGFSLVVSNEYSFWDSLRYASFQVVSIISTTGYITGDYLAWGGFAHILLLIIMIVGGCAGSTSGGIKCVRAMLLVKQGGKELQRLIHPHAVIVLKLGKNSVPARVSSAIFGFFFLYMLVLTVSLIVLTSAGVELVTAVSAVISCLSNVGPGLGEVGPLLNYSALPQFAKLVLSFCMIVGRLEILTVLVVFTRYFWRD